MERGNFDDALTSFRHAAALKPSLPEAHANLADALMKTRQIDASLREVRWALELDPEVPESHWLAAIAYWKTGSRAVAITEWVKAAIHHFLKVVRRRRQG